MIKYLVHFIAIIIGIGFWTIISLISGEIEAWDSPLYFSIGFPIFLFLNFLLGIIKPKNPWRWGLLSSLSQIIPLGIMATGTANMWPLGLILMSVFSIPAILAAYIGSLLSLKLFKFGRARLNN